MDTFPVSVSRHQAEQYFTDEGDGVPPDDYLAAQADALGEFVAPAMKDMGADDCREALLDKTGVTSHRSLGVIDRKRFLQGQKLAAKLGSVGKSGLAFKLAECHTRLTVKQCHGCGRRNAFWNRCDIFYCPQCAPRLAAKRLKELTWWVDTLKQPKHIVLTLRNVDKLTSRFVADAKKALSRFRRTKLFSGVRGGLWAMEITNKGKGWHLHFHLVVDSPWMDVRAVSAAWSKSNDGKGEVVWVEDASRGGLRANLPRYVTKYCGKGFDISEWDEFTLADFVDAFASGRTFGVFGNLLGARGEWREFVRTSRIERRKCECGCGDFSYVAWEKLRADLCESVDRGRVGDVGRAVSRLYSVVPGLEVCAAANSLG